MLSASLERNGDPAFSLSSLEPQQIRQNEPEHSVAAQATLINPLLTPTTAEISPTNLDIWQKKFRPLFKDFALHQTFANLNWNSKMPFHMCLMQELYILTQKIDIGK